MNIQDYFGSSYIGLRGSCNYNTSTSGLWINNLPGITLSKFAATANDEQVRGESLFGDLHNQAILEVVDDFEGLLMKQSKIQMNAIVDSAKIGYFDPVNTIWIAKEMVDKGLEIRSYDQDRYTVLYIEYLEVKAKAPADKKVFIEDSSGTTEYQFKLIKGINKLNLRHSSNDNLIRVYMNTCDIELAEIRSVSTDSCNCSVSSDNHGFAISAIKRNGATEEFDYSGSYDGFSIAVQRKCSIKEFVSEIRDELKIPILYKIAILLLQETIAGNRTNPIVRNSEDSAKELLEMWHGSQNVTSGAFTPGLYWKKLTTTVNKVKGMIDLSSICFTCESMRIVESTP